MKYFISIFIFSFISYIHNQIIIPHALREIRLVSPSFKLSSISSLNNAVARLRTDFAKCDYSSSIEKDGVLNVWRKYYPDTPLNRSNDLKDAIFNDINKSIIWAVRGGRNSAELFEFFPHDKNNEINREICLIGYSDITAIHYFMSLYYPNIKTIHGDVANGIPLQSHAINYLLIKEIIDGKVTKIVDIQSLNTLAGNTLRIDNTSVLGGNLALTLRSLKTKWQPNFTNKIVILEEIDEPADTIEIWLNQIKLNGLFNNAKAIIFGQFIESVAFKNHEIERNDEILKELEDLVNYYKSRNYLDLEIDYTGGTTLNLNNISIYSFPDLQHKIGVEELPAQAKSKLIITFNPNESTTRLETALLQFYQSKFIENSTKIIILWDALNKYPSNVTQKREFRTIDSVIRDFASKINIPVFKSEAFGHLNYNLPIPFGTLSSLYSEKTTGCQGTCNRFILEVKSPFLK